MNLVIERDIPPPTKNNGIRDTLRAMEVGESVLITGKKPNQVQAYVQAVRCGRYYQTKAMTTGTRVWRLE